MKNNGTKKMMNRIGLWLIALMVALGVSATASAQQPSGSSDQVFDVVEVMPQFPGGMDGLKSWLAQNLRYPVESQKKGESGRVLVQFVVNKDGSLSDCKVLRATKYPALNKEALRLVKKMPKWTPGQQKGMSVRVRYTLPIAFNLK